MSQLIARLKQFSEKGAGDFLQEDAVIVDVGRDINLSPDEIKLGFTVGKLRLYLQFPIATLVREAMVP